MKQQRVPKKKPEEIRRDPLQNLPMNEEDWAEFERAVRLFNTGKFWNAHEAWELLWQSHAEDERLFFQGLIQLAAAYHQLVEKENYRGMMNNFDKAYGKLEVFSPEYLGVHVKPLLSFIQEAKREAEKLGADGLQNFNYNLIPKLQFHRPENPDLMVELRAILHDDQFLEGIRLFNKGYHWEAHELWEDVWRAQEGDAKMFIQAFVQLAAGYSFIRLSKPTSARYLFEKASEKLQEFENINCGVPLQPLAEGAREALAYIAASGNGGGAKPLSIPQITVNGK